MSQIDRILPTPRKLEIDSVEVALPPEKAWELVRHLDLGRAPLVRALFELRTLPARLGGRAMAEPSFRIEDLKSSNGRPGFQLLVDGPPELVVGAIGKVWHADIPFVHVPSAEEFEKFSQPGFVKVAWAIRISRVGDADSRITVEVRVDATDEPSWKKFRRYFRVIGPWSHFIRRTTLSTIAREYGTPEEKERERSLIGDELLPDAQARATHGITISARPEMVWPWLVQMGCRRAGFYSVDWLDNGGKRSAREIHPEFQDLEVGDRVPATPRGETTFEVLAMEPNRALVLGGLYDTDQGKQLPFRAPRPAHFWHATWSFVLEPLDELRTRLHVRGSVAFPKSERLRAAWMRPVHVFMQSAQLRHLAARAEGRVPKDGLVDVAEGVGGAAVMTAAFLTSFLRGKRNHWGLPAASANRQHPGDEILPEPRWSWTHGIEVDAPAARVWPWVAQVGADRAGFYSYQWLENMVGCNLQNAETVHPEWAVRKGGSLLLHPKMPPLSVVQVEPGRYFVAHASDGGGRAAGKAWVEATWLFLVEPLGELRSRVISRYRCSCSNDLATRLRFGQTFAEPVGFAMDRRMLIGIKERAERERASRTLGPLTAASLRP